MRLQSRPLSTNWRVQFGRAIEWGDVSRFVSPVGQRDPRLDLGRVISALAVIYLHCADRYTWVAHGAIRLVAFLIYSAALFCVPVFLMISGSLLIGKQIQGISQFVHGRLLVLLKPFLFGAIFYLVWGTFYQKQPPASFFAFAQSFLSGSPYFHLWFLPALFCSYLLLPFLQDFSPRNHNLAVFATGILFLLCALNIFLSPNGLSLGLFMENSQYLPYFLCGFIISRIFHVKTTVAIPLFLIATALTALLLAVVSHAAGHRSGFAFQEFDSPLVILQSLSVFSLILCCSARGWLYRISQFYAPNTLGIYIVHYAILVMLLDYSTNHLHVPALFTLTVTPLVTFILSDILVRALHRIPGLRGFI